MWARFRFTKFKKGQNESEQVSKNLNINEEYFSALRTKSFADFITKAQYLVNEPSTPSFCHHKFSEILLEPGQDVITDILESPILSNNPDLKNLMREYFDVSAKASRICSHILNKIYQIQTTYKNIQEILEIFYDYDHSLGHFQLIILKNPFSNSNKQEFNLLHDEYSLLLHQLNLKRKKVAKKIKMIKCFKKTSGICVTATCSLVAIASMILAAHTLTALVMGPAILSFPFKAFKKKILSSRFFKNGILGKISEQLDVAAKGTYILKRDFDTMGRLVSRLYDDIEHNKAMIQMCYKKREENRVSLVEALVKELKKSDVGVRRQVEELEEHVYLCLVTINRARALVIEQMTTTKVL